MAARVDYHAVAVRAAQRAGINPAIFLRQIQQESGFNPNARSSAGAIGIAQIVPRWHPGVDPTDPVASLNYAAHLMGTLVRKYGGYAPALSVYNSGQPNTYKDPNFAGGQTSRYVSSILGGQDPAVQPAPPPLASVVQQQAGARPLPVAPPGGGAVRALLAASLKQGNAMLGLPNIPLQTLAPLQALAAPRLASSSSVVPALAPAPTAGGFAFPLATKNDKVIGTPYKGTHTLYGNWESDNAIDLATPVGTPVYAAADGVIGSQLGALNSTDPHLLGERLHLNTKSNEFYYAHLSNILVKPGQRVRRGQLIGYSGAANGVAHLHIASRRGNPLAFFEGRS